MNIEQPRRGLVALALIASFMVFVDSTIVNLALANLASRLHATRAELEWAVNAYTLSFAAGMLGAGTITDTFGARRVFIAGLIVFTAASAACGAAGSMGALCLARLAQGMGSALLLPSALVLATTAAGDEQARRRLVGWWAAAGGVGMASGPLLGGALVALAGWRAVFIVNVVIGFPVIAWGLRTIPELPGRARRLDIAGMGAATALIGGLVFALIEAPTQGWTSPAVVAAAALAVAGGIAFVVVERSAAAPLLPVGVYADRGFGGVALQGALLNFAFYGLMFALGLMLQQGRGLGALGSGLMFLPLTGLIWIGTLCAAPFAQRLGSRTVLRIGMTMMAATLLAVAWASTSSALWPLALALMPVGLSGGLLVPTMTSQSMAAVEPTLHGAASAAFNTSRQVGSAIGVATFGPLLGTLDESGRGFVTCVAMGAAAVLAALALTVTRSRTAVA